MPKVYYGAKSEPSFELKQSNDLIAVRTRSGRSMKRSIGPVPSPEEDELKDATLVAAFPEANVEVFRIPPPARKASPDSTTLESKKRALRASPDVRFAGGVLVDPVSKEPVLYTENLFVKFIDSADPDDCREVLRAAGLVVKEEVSYAANAFFVEAPEGTGQKIFEIAEKLLKRPDVEYCHPELIRRRGGEGRSSRSNGISSGRRSAASLSMPTPNVEAAHEITRGEGVTIAVIDDGVDIDHPEFAGAGKVVAPRDATVRIDDPRPKDRSDHTVPPAPACAAAAGTVRCLGRRARSTSDADPPGLRDLGSQHEADAFMWAADHGADVISCSWGPPDGDWCEPNDPVHNQVVPLPPSTRLAIDYVTTNGRGGKGCVVLFAAGNGNESVDNDGYASYPKVIAVAACNDRGKRSVYSDFGKRGLVLVSQQRLRP